MGARYCQQATPVVGDGEDGLTDLGERTIPEDTADTQRKRHAGDHLNRSERDTLGHLKERSEPMVATRTEATSRHAGEWPAPLAPVAPTADHAL
ncbi:hypothetical protein Adi01nite_32180 [Amorphoplanes digitatis]|nr:hypothetical protein Adi01nite_32180 [Actinoplanes digitatis]